MDGQPAPDALYADVEVLQKELARLHEPARQQVVQRQDQTGCGDESTKSKSHPKPFFTAGQIGRCWRLRKATQAVSGAISKAATQNK